MIKIIRKRTGNISIPFTLKKSSIFHRIADITDRDLLFPGTIKINPTLLPPNFFIDIEWRLVNLTKNIIIEDGVGEKTFENMEPGLYSVEYKPIQGYITPNISVKNLEERQTIFFDAIYEEGMGGGGTQTGTINIFMNLILGGWKVELLDDDNNVLFSIPENGYSNLLEYSQSGLPLGKYRIQIKEINTPIISPTEIERIQYLTDENNSINWSVIYDNPTQFQTHLNMNVNDSRVSWEIDAKYREDDPITGIGDTQQIEIFVAEQNEVWRLKIPDNLRQFERHIIRVRDGNNTVSDVLFRNNQTNEYRYGYDEDKLLFKMNNINNIFITAKDTTNINIPKMRFSLDVKNFINQHGVVNFSEMFNPLRVTNPFYENLFFDVKRYWNPDDLNPEKTLTVRSVKLFNIISPFFITDPVNAINYFNIGFFKISINRDSIITLFSLEIDSQGNPIGIDTIYSNRITETPILVIDLDNNFIPLIDISI